VVLLLRVFVVIITRCAAPPSGEVAVDQPPGDRADLPHGASTATCGRNFFASINSANNRSPTPARSTLISSWNSVSP